MRPPTREPRNRRGHRLACKPRRRLALLLKPTGFGFRWPATSSMQRMRLALGVAKLDDLATETKSVSRCRCRGVAMCSRCAAGRRLSDLMPKTAAPMLSGGGVAATARSTSCRLPLAGTAVIFIPPACSRDPDRPRNIEPTACRCSTATTGMLAAPQARSTTASPGRPASARRRRRPQP